MEYRLLYRTNVRLLRHNIKSSRGYIRFSYGAVLQNDLQYSIFSILEILAQGQACRFCGGCDGCEPCPSSSKQGVLPPALIPEWTRKNCTACRALSPENAEALARDGNGVVCDPSCLTGDTLNCNIFDLVRHAVSSNRKRPVDREYPGYVDFPRQCVTLSFYSK